MSLNWAIRIALAAYCSFSEGAASTVKGRVLELAGGRPTPRAVVSLHTISPTSLVVAEALTDASGTFSLAGVPAGAYRLAVDHHDLVMASASDVIRVVHADARVTTTVWMAKGASIGGRVRGADVSNLTIQAVRLASCESRRELPVDLRYTGTVDRLGHYRIGRLEPGCYLVRAVPQHALPDRGQAAVYHMSTGRLPALVKLSSGEDRPEIDVEVLSLPAAEAFTVRGQVTGEGVDITSVLLLVRQSGSAFWVSTRPTPTGEFEVALPSGVYEVTAHSPAQMVGVLGSMSASASYFGAQQITVHEGSQGPLSIRMEKTASIEGAVTSVGELCPPSVKIVATPGNPHHTEVSVRPEKTGRFSFGGLIPDHYTIHADGDDQLCSVTRVAANDLDLPTVELRTAGRRIAVFVEGADRSVSGTVSPKVFQELGMVVVAAIPVDDTWSQPRLSDIRTATVGGDGTYVVNGLHRGLYVLLGLSATLLPRLSEAKFVATGLSRGQKVILTSVWQANIRDTPTLPVGEREHK